jgi:DNA-binding XRE family transcriptional regulator
VKAGIDNRSVVRSKRDGSTGVVVRTHKELPGDPVQALVRWHDGTALWHALDSLELVLQPSASIETELSDLDGEVMPTGFENRKWFVGRQLRKMRKLRGLTQHKLADAAAIKRDHIADIEVGRSDIPLSLFIHLCLTLNVEPSEFLELGLHKEDKTG